MTTQQDTREPEFFASDLKSDLLLLKNQIQNQAEKPSCFPKIRRIIMEHLNVISFGAEDIENILAQMTKTQLDKLAFGTIQLDKTGKILSYNAAEAEITGRNSKEVIGKNFFTEVAPCTRRPEFYGVFLEGVKNNNLNNLFEYVFDYNMKPTKVKVHMKKAIVGDTYWIIVKRL